MTDKPILTRAEVLTMLRDADSPPSIQRSVELYHTILQAVELLECMLCAADCECKTCLKTQAFLAAFNGEKGE